MSPTGGTRRQTHRARTMRRKSRRERVIFLDRGKDGSRMARQAVTFDFHNTLAACPEWFELEVRRLPSAFLQWRASSTSLPVDPELSAEADVRYRQLRHEIMD